MTDTRLSYADYCKQHIIDELQNYRGTTVYACDLGHSLTEAININGSATYDIREAKEYINLWWDEAVEIYKYQKDNYGECLHNPFEAPSAFHVCMIIEGVNSILAQCPVIDDAWNEEIILDDKTIAKIVEYVETVDEIEF